MKRFRVIKTETRGTQKNILHTSAYEYAIIHELENIVNELSGAGIL